MAQNEQLDSPACAPCGSDAVSGLARSRRAPGPADLESVFRSSGDEPLQDELARCDAPGLGSRA